MNKTKVEISVLIATYNNCEELRFLLESLLTQKNIDDVNYEIIVVNNNSKDKTRELIEEFIPRFAGRLKAVMEQLQGIAHARNRGIKEAKGEIIAFTDSDCVVDENWLSEIILAYKKYDTDAVQGKVILATPIPHDVWYPDSFIKQRLAHVDYGDKALILEGQDLVTANASFRKRVFDNFGAFNSSAPYKASEDTEFSLRLAKAGVKRMYVPSIKAYHHFALDRLNEKKLIRQSYYWGRSAILSDEIHTSYFRYFLYCLKRYLYFVFVLGGQYMKYDHKKIFFTKCKISTYYGRCVQLITNFFAREEHQR